MPERDVLRAPRTSVIVRPRPSFASTTPPKSRRKWLASPSSVQLTAAPQCVAGQSPNGAGPPAACGRNAGTNAKFVWGVPPRPLCTQWPAVQTTLRFALSTSVAEQTQSVPSGRFEKSRPMVRVPGRSVVTSFALGLSRVRFRRRFLCFGRR
jgi:hypothetical protein